MPWEKRKTGDQWCVYKEGAEKALACHASEEEANDHLAALNANSAGSYTLDAEVFAVGKWNGMAFSTDDLQGMVSAFESLREYLKAPLKFGHNDEQPMTDGQPALGWVDKLWVDGSKLMARFKDMPKVVYDAIKAKRYSKVSIELDIDVDHKGKSYPYVLSGVALLGADIPAVSTLKDLDYFMSRDASFSVGRHAVFSAIAGQLHQSGDSTMATLEELTKQVAALTAQVASLTSEKVAFTAEKAAMADEIAKFKKADAERQAAERATSVKTKRAQITQMFDRAVKANAITPAQRDMFAKIAKIDDDDAVLAIDVKDVEALAGLTGKNFAAEGAGGGQATEIDTRPADVRVTEGVREILAKKEAENFAAAQALLFTRNPALGREYINMTEEA